MTIDRRIVAVGIASSIIAGIVAGVAQAAPRTVEDFLDAVSAIGEPEFDAERKAEPGYMDRYRAAQHRLYQQKAALLLELADAHADDPRVPEWHDRRWELLAWNQQPHVVANEVLDDIETILARVSDPAVVRHADYWRAHFLIVQADGRPRQMLAVMRGFLEDHPDDERGAILLQNVVEQSRAGADLRRQVYERLARSYPETHYGMYAPGLLRRDRALAERAAFDVSFTDAISGESVAVDKLSGKVVIVDFWATTCGPCLKQMPALKTLHATQRRNGVELIGISLDEADSVDQLRDVIRDLEIPWPQYYQGNGYESEFSMAWGVGSAPTLFVLDREGRLRAAVHDHEALEQWVRRLLDE